MGLLGNFLNYIKMSRTLSRLKGDGKISLSRCHSGKEPHLTLMGESPGFS